MFEQRDTSTDVLHLTGLEQIGDDVKAFSGERVAGLAERRRDVLRHRVAPRSEGLEDRTRTHPLCEPHHDGPEPVWGEQYREPGDVDHEAPPGVGISVRLAPVGGLARAP